MADGKGMDWGKIDAAAGGVRQPAGETIVVQCATGHRLVVPATLAGKRAKCSKCQESFQIPAVGESGAVSTARLAPQAVAPTAEHASPPPASDGADMFVGLEGTPASASAAVIHPASGISHADVPPEAEVGVDHDAHKGHVPANASVATLVARLWQETEHGGKIELQLVGGTKITPSWFDPRWSSGTHGLFASESPNQRVTLTVIAWDAIQMVVVRDVDGLPDGMFE
ncbi:MAG: hypothetical protein ACKOTB_11535 [Planctomycetia bacterium]